MCQHIHEFLTQANSLCGTVACCNCRVLYIDVLHLALRPPQATSLRLRDVCRHACSCIGRACVLVTRFV